MNGKGIEKFLGLVKVGDELSVSYTHYGEKMSYHGVVTEITDSSVWVKNNLELEFFEALATPAINEIKLAKIWWYCVTKEDGIEIAV